MVWIVIKKELRWRVPARASSQFSLDQSSGDMGMANWCNRLLFWAHRILPNDRTVSMLKQLQMTHKCTFQTIYHIKHKVKNHVGSMWKNINQKDANYMAWIWVERVWPGRRKTGLVWNEVQTGLCYRLSTGDIGQARSHYPATVPFGLWMNHPNQPDKDILLCVEEGKLSEEALREGLGLLWMKWVLL